MALSLGNATASNGGSINLAITTAGSSGVLVYAIVVNGGIPANNTVSSSTLGSWGSPRAQGASGNYIQYWSRPFTSSLVAETISASFPSASFTEAQLFEINGCATSSYFDTNVGLPVTSAGPDPVSISTTAANTFIFGLFRMGVQSNPTAGAGWARIFNDTNNLLCEYKIVSAAQTSLSVTIGNSPGDSNGCIADAIIALVGGTVFSDTGGSFDASLAVRSGNERRRTIWST